MITDTMLGWIMVIVGLVGSALCSGTETGLYTLNRVRLSVQTAPGAPANRRARALKNELDKPERALAVLLIGNTLFGSLAATGVGILLTLAGYSEPAAVLLNILILTPTIIILAEIMPKELFRLEADRWTPALVPFLVGMRLLFTILGIIPLILLLMQASKRALRLGEQARISSGREAVANLLKEGARHGLLSESQTSLLDRALAMRTTTVGDEMVRWPRARTIEQHLDRSRLLQFLTQSTFSRFPVVDPSGRVVGVVEHLDISLYPKRPLQDLMRPVLVLPPHITVREALRLMGEHGGKLAVVGSTARPLGIVTAKDLVEPLIGELGAW
ncbi:MAG: DUF21 domain-containing protein [Phycisphaeraceae bacterium]|nr:DUF21 domain-containing protein [Phycisphaeraceae bacterium]